MKINTEWIRFLVYNLPTFQYLSNKKVPKMPYFQASGTFYELRKMGLEPTRAQCTQDP